MGLVVWAVPTLVSITGLPKKLFNKDPRFAGPESLKDGPENDMLLKTKVSST